MAVSMPLTAFSGMHDASTQKQRDGRGARMEMANTEMLDELTGSCLAHADKIGLTEEQLTKMKPVHSDMKKKNVRFKADLKIAEIELVEIMDVKDFDVEKAGAAVRKIADIKTAYNMELLNTMKSVRAGLTEEQFRNMQKAMPMKVERKKPSHRMMKK
jgi:Spy/CpxP family protein refolding chaperone